MIAYTFATMAVECISDGGHGRMMAIRNGCYVDTPIPDPGLGARRVDIETMYNQDRFRPNYSRKANLPIFLTRA
jgi:6-phosphofructokinase 1